MNSKTFITLAVIVITAAWFWSQYGVEPQVAPTSLKAQTTQENEPSSTVRLQTKLKFDSIKVELLKLVPPPNNFANTRWQWQTKEYDDDWCLLEELTPDARQTAAIAYQDYRDATGFLKRELRDGESGYKPVITGYESYDVDTLVKLGSQGDLTALSYLARESDVSAEYKQWAYLTSYLHGGTALTIHHMIENFFRAEWSLSQSKDYNSELLAAAKKKMIKGLSYALFAIEGRGDRSALLALSDFIERRNSAEFINGRNNRTDSWNYINDLYPITAEDIAQARALSQDFLLETNQKRRELGIGGELQPAGQKIHSSANRSLAWRIANSKDVDYGLINDIAVPKTACFENTVAMFRAVKAKKQRLGG